MLFYILKTLTQKIEMKEQRKTRQTCKLSWNSCMHNEQETKCFLMWQLFTIYRKQCLLHIEKLMQYLLWIESICKYENCFDISYHFWYFILILDMIHSFETLLLIFLYFPYTELLFSYFLSKERMKTSLDTIVYISCYL